MELTEDAATVGGTAGVAHPTGSPEAWAVTAQGPWLPSAPAPFSLEVWAKGTTAGWAPLAYLGDALHVASVTAEVVYVGAPGVLNQQITLRTPTATIAGTSSSSRPPGPS